MKIRKLPVVVDGVQFTGHNIDEIRALDGENRVFKATQAQAAGVHHGVLWEHCLWIRTKEGGHVAKPTDWIIRGVAGELYPCDAVIFNATYEVVK